MTAGRPVQRAGHIGAVDNRFCGRAVFGELATTARTTSDLLLLAFGVELATDDDREIVRLMHLALTSPDARVWPLKLTRTLAAYGNPVAGFHGAQLGNDSARMGPGTGSGAAASLAWIAARVGPAPSDEAVAAAVEQHRRERGHLLGFGVPFRAEDERLRGLRRLLADHPATGRRHWRLHEQVIRAMAAAGGPPPNIVLALVALMLDLGLAPHRAGMLIGVIMTHTFVAHALEAADDDGPLLQELPRAAIDYQGPPARRSPAEAARLATRAPGASAGGRRSLAW